LFNLIAPTGQARWGRASLDWVGAGVTQEELAARLHTKKTAISRIENHAEDIKLSTLERFAEAIGKRLALKIA